MKIQKLFRNIFAFVLVFIAPFSLIGCDDPENMNPAVLYPKYIEGVKSALEKISNPDIDKILVGPNEYPLRLDIKEKLDACVSANPEKYEKKRKSFLDLFVKSISYSVGTGELLLRTNEEFTNKIIAIKDPKQPNENFVIKVLEGEDRMMTNAYSSDPNMPYVYSEFYYTGINDFYVKVFIHDLHNTDEQQVIYIDSSLRALYIHYDPSFSQSMQANFIDCIYMNNDFKKGHEFDPYRDTDFNFLLEIMESFDREINSAKSFISEAMEGPIHKTYQLSEFTEALDRVFPPTTDK